MNHQNSHYIAITAVILRFFVIRIKIYDLWSIILFL